MPTSVHLPPSRVPLSLDQPVSNTRLFRGPRPRVVPPTATAKGSEAVAVRPGVSPDEKYRPTPSAAARTSIACTVCRDTSPTGICHELDTMEALGRRPLPFSTARTARTAPDPRRSHCRRPSAGWRPAPGHRPLRSPSPLRPCTATAPHQATEHRTGRPAGVNLPELAGLR